MLRILAAIVCIVIVYNGFEKDNNLMFFGGIIGVCVFLLWELASVWGVVGECFDGF